MNVYKIILTVGTALFLSACVSNVNTHNADRHFQIASAATQNGDWTTARKQWAKTLVNAELSKTVSTPQLALINYEYGRALGVQCFFEESEKYLLKAYNLDRQANGPSHMDLVELARLSYDQKKYEQAVPYFERAIKSLDKLNSAEKAPAEYKFILQEYLNALKYAGHTNKTAAVAAQIKSMTQRAAQSFSITDRTPYGTRCLK